MNTHKDFECVQIKKSLKTRKVLSEAVKLAGTDSLGRKIPVYAVIHAALVEYVEKRKADEEDPQDALTKVLDEATAAYARKGSADDTGNAPSER